MKSFGKFTYIFIFFGLIFAGFCTEMQAAYAVTQQALDRVVAVVNDDVITQRQLDQHCQMARKEMQANNVSEPNKIILEKKILNQMIDQRIAVQMAKRFGLTISDAELDTNIQSIAKKNNMSMEAFKNMIVQSGLNWTTYRKELRDQMLMQKVLYQAVGPEVHISPQEIKNAIHSTAYLQQAHVQYKLGDILVPLPEEPSSAELVTAQKTAAAIIQALKKGESFDNLALDPAYSRVDFSDPGDWISFIDLPSQFVEQIKKMQSGQISPVIRTGNGLHILKLFAVKQSGMPPVTETKVRHILIKVNTPADRAIAKAKIEKIRQQILHGASFANLAKLYSEDPISAARGGELGWVMPGILVPPFETAMNQLKIGQLSQPIETSYGWHLIEVEARRTIRNPTYYQDASAKQLIYQKKFKELSQNWLMRMRNASYIKIMLP